MLYIVSNLYTYFISLPDLEITPVLYYLLLYEGIYLVSIRSKKLCAWVADNLALLLSFFYLL